MFLQYLFGLLLSGQACRAGVLMSKPARPYFDSDDYTSDSSFDNKFLSRDSSDHSDFSDTRLNTADIENKCDSQGVADKLPMIIS